MGKIKRVLVVYYSQSGQLLKILQSLLAPLSRNEQIEVDFCPIRLKQDFPFPWSYFSFFDAQPESVLEVPAELAPMDLDLSKDYDLVVLGYQTWFLSPSIPITSFLQSEAAKQVIADKPVITVNGCRNMWIQSQISLKKQVQDLGGRLNWNITLVDRSPNVTSVVTIPAWMLSGKRKFFSWLPAAGVNEEDITALSQYGEVLQAAVLQNQLEQNFSEDYPTEVQPNLILLEQNGKRIFKKWAGLIRLFGGPGSLSRLPLLLLFSVYLITAISIMFPVNILVFQLYKTLFRRKLEQRVDSYSKNRF